MKEEKLDEETMGNGMVTDVELDRDFVFVDATIDYLIVLRRDPNRYFSYHDRYLI